MRFESLMAVDPWFSHWNYELLRILFQFIPHTEFADECVKVLLSAPLVSTWVFAACFYRFWTINDERTTWRRHSLVSAILALAIANVVTLVLRPWIHWPAPARNPAFQALFPSDLWGSGTANCFPSHSTLAYFTIALGFWQLNRRLSLLLSGMVLLFISLPRMYAGGHYPVDVLFSCLLAILVLAAVMRWPGAVEALYSSSSRLATNFKDLVFFLWVFELGEGFHSGELLVSLARRVLLSH
jgi:membrane-associated phospholipid phosphatase